MLNRATLITVALVLSNLFSAAQETRYGNHTLKVLLTERKELIGDYGDSIEKGTGLFGLTTKRDLKKANGILLSIIKKDNQIMRQLESEADGGKIDTKLIDNQLQELEEKHKQDLKIIDKLNSKVDEKEAQIDELRGSLNTYKMLTILLSIISIVITIRYLRLKNA